MVSISDGGCFLGPDASGFCGFPDAIAVVPDLLVCSCAGASPEALAIYVLLESLVGSSSICGWWWVSARSSAAGLVGVVIMVSKMISSPVPSPSRSGEVAVRSGEVAVRSGEPWASRATGRPGLPMAAGSSATSCPGAESRGGPCPRRVSGWLGIDEQEHVDAAAAVTSTVALQQEETSYSPVH